ncbi:MAG: hypothetical protein V3R96_06010 [Dehalococcoidales bacterium]
MTVIRNLDLPLDREQILLRLERGGFRPVPRIINLAEKLLEIFSGLVEPSFVYEVIPGKGHNSKKVPISIPLPVGLRPASQIALVVATIGPGLEKKVAECFAQKEATRALILDRIGNTAVGLLQKRAFEFIKDEVVPPGFMAANPLKPGGLCWHISAQQSIFKLVSPEQIGVSLSSGATMLPRKSGSMAIGISAGGVDGTPPAVCTRCKMGRGCAFRTQTVDSKNGEIVGVPYRSTLNEERTT